MLFVAPPSRTLYVCAVPAALIPVVTVKFPCKSTIVPDELSEILTVPALKALEKTVPPDCVTVTPLSVEPRLFTVTDEGPPLLTTRLPVRFEPLKSAV